MSNKCILIGMDGANPAFVLRLVKEGRLPNFKRMLKEGTLAPHCLSSLPTSTPENWTTIATGAWNGTHQVMSFQVFQPPELHGNWMAGYTSEESQAEFIWDALALKFGERVVLNMSFYPKEGNPLWGQYSTKAVAHAVEVYSRFTFDYPYPVSISVLTGRGGGMEYPTAASPSRTAPTPRTGSGVSSALLSMRWGTTSSP